MKKRPSTFRQLISAEWARALCASHLSPEAGLPSPSALASTPGSRGRRSCRGRQSLACRNKVHEGSKRTVRASTEKSSRRGHCLTNQRLTRSCSFGRSTSARSLYLSELSQVREALGRAEVRISHSQDSIEGFVIDAMQTMQSD